MRQESEIKGEVEMEGGEGGVLIRTLGGKYMMKRREEAARRRRRRAGGGGVTER